MIQIKYALICIMSIIPLCMSGQHRNNPASNENGSSKDALYLNRFEFTDSLLYSITADFSKQIEECTYFDEHYCIFIYPNRPNEIIIGGYRLGKRSNHLTEYAYKLNNQIVLCDKGDIKHSILRNFVSINYSQPRICLKNFGLDEGIEADDDEGIQLILTFDGKKLVKSELYYDCELCPPVDKSLFPEGTEFHLWRCDEE